MTTFLFGQDKYLHRNKINTINDFNNSDIKSIIKKFLKSKGMPESYLEIFYSFSTELLLHAKVVGVEKLLLQSPAFVGSLSKKLITVESNSPKKEQKIDIGFKEIEGNLEENAPISLLKKD